MCAFSHYDLGDHVPTPAQKLAVVLAFVAAALSLAAAALRIFRDGAVDVTLALGGLLMLVLGIGGYVKVMKG